MVKIYVKIREAAAMARPGFQSDRNYPVIGVDSETGQVMVADEEFGEIAHFHVRDCLLAGYNDSGSELLKACPKSGGQRLTERKPWLAIAIDYRKNRLLLADTKSKQFKYFGIDECLWGSGWRAAF